MSDDDGAITRLDEARERRERRELPAAMTLGTIVRRGYGLRPFCTHRETVVDGLARVVQCRACGADLDPISVIEAVAHEHDLLVHRINERTQIDAALIAMRAEEKRIKARLRTARRGEPSVDGEAFDRSMSVNRSRS